MDSLRHTLASLAPALADGPTRKRWLALALLLLMLGGGVLAYPLFVGSSKAELLPVPASPEQTARILALLQERCPVEVAGGKLYVPTDKLAEARAALAAAHLDPSAPTAAAPDAFDKLADSATLFNSEAQNDRLWTVARQNVLAGVIANFPTIASAHVVIAPGERAALGRPAVPTTASVTVTTKTGEPLTRPQVEAIAETVCGAVSGLQRAQLHLTDGQRAYAVEEETRTPLGLKRALEADAGRKIREQLEHAGAVKIAVNLELPAVPGTAASTATGTPPSAAPGVTPAATTGATPSTVSGALSSVGTASVSLALPRSYARRVFQQRHPEAVAAESNAAFPPLLQELAETARHQAAHAIGLADAAVRVDWYDDAPAAAAAPVSADTIAPRGTLPQWTLAAVGGLMVLVSWWLFRPAKRGVGVGERKWPGSVATATETPAAEASADASPTSETRIADRPQKKSPDAGLTLDEALPRAVSAEPSPAAAVARRWMEE